MSLLILFSLLMKCFGATIEIISHAFISQIWNVEIYGTYAFFIALADGIYALLFSGIIKFNNYYIPQGKDVSGFRKKYYIRYVIPICLVGIIISIANKNLMLVLAVCAGFAYLCAMDSSSRMMSLGIYKPALIGEYCIGRSFVLLAVLIISFSNFKYVEILYVIYGLQFCVDLIYYALVNRKKIVPKLTEDIDTNHLKRYAVFQSTEIAHTIIMQTSIIVQYLFSGAYQTAVVSIVLIVRKVINFISGPATKLYQPEFAKRYKMGDRQGLSDIYAQITRIQLCFMLPVFTFFLTKPELLLSIFNKQLVDNTTIVRVTSFVFLFMIAFGPLANFLAMTGNEKTETRINWISVFVMYSTMFIFKQNEYFVIIGFCVQIVFSTLYKLLVYVKYMHSFTMSLVDYLKLMTVWLPTIFALSTLPDNIFLTGLVCVVQILLNFIFVLPHEERDAAIAKILRRR